MPNSESFTVDVLCEIWYDLSERVVAYRTKVLTCCFTKFASSHMWKNDKASGIYIDFFSVLVSFVPHFFSVDVVTNRVLKAVRSDGTSYWCYSSLSSHSAYFAAVSTLISSSTKLLYSTLHWKAMLQCRSQYHFAVSPNISGISPFPQSNDKNPND